MELQKMGMKDRCLGKQPTQNTVVFISTVGQTKILCLQKGFMKRKRAPKLSFHTWLPQRITEPLTDIRVKSQVNTISFPEQDS